MSDLDLDFFSVSVTPVKWQSSQSILTDIRTRVFVEGQNVPLELEIDKYDADAQHWLAADDNGNPMGTARLVIDEHIGKIGRLAVCDSFRNQGVGSALMRRVINDAARQGLHQLTLASQCQAIGFYELFGFVASGPEFDDAGIAHRKMDLDLGPYRHLATSIHKPAKQQDLKIDGLQNYADQLIKLASTSTHSLQIYSAGLNKNLYGNPQLITAITTLATATLASKIDILVADLTQLEKETHALHELAERLSSSIEIRQLNPETHREDKDFAIADTSGWLRIADPVQWRGYGNFNNPATAQQLQQHYDELWRHSLPCSLIRRLKI